MPFFLRFIDKKYGLLLCLRLLSKVSHLPSLPLEGKVPSLPRRMRCSRRRYEWRKAKFQSFFHLIRQPLHSLRSLGLTPSPQGEGYEVQCEHLLFVGRTQDVI